MRTRTDPIAMASTPVLAQGRRVPDLGRRTVTILWGLPIIAACVWFGGWLLLLGAAVLTAVGIVEFWPLGRPFGVAGALRSEVGAGALLLLVGARLGPGPFSGALGAAVVISVVGGLVRAAATPGGDALRAELGGTVWAILALLYIPWLLGYVLLLRESGPGPLGLHRTVAALGLVWLGDVIAFLTGGAFGRHRLAASISPGKTVEGAVSAVVVGAIAGAALGGWIGLPAWAAGVTGTALGGIGLAGDLWESLVKRAAAVKDSGTGVPGHGGVLDRFDSLLLGAPVAYWLLERVPWSQLLHRFHP